MKSAAKTKPVCPKCRYDLTGQRDQVCPECGRPFTWEEARAAKRSWWRRKGARVVTSLIACFLFMYAPFSWVWVMDYPWSDSRWFWAKNFLGLPALLPTHFTARWFDLRDVDDSWGILIIHIVSISLLVLLTWIASRRWWLLCLILPPLLFISIFNGIAAYHAFRM